MNTDYGAVITSKDEDIHFTWLNLLVMYSPMVSRISSSQQKRSSCYITIYLISTILSILLIRGYTSTIRFTNNQMLENDALFDIIWFLVSITGLLSRSLSIYYFYVHFNYPWNAIHNIKKTYNYYLCLITVATLLAYLVGISIDTMYFPLNDPIHWIWSLLFFINILLPTVITFSVAATIFLQYQMELHTLLTTLSVHRRISISRISVHCIHLQPLQQPPKCKEFNFCNFFNQYEKVRKQFQMDYHKSLNWSVQSYLLVLVLYIWKNTYYLVYEAEWRYLILFAADILHVCLFVITGSMVTETFDKFKNKLFDYGFKFIGQNNDCNDRLDYQYLLWHVMNKPVVIRVGNFAVTKCNALKFVLGFAIAKFVAYIVYALNPNLF